MIPVTIRKRKFGEDGIMNTCPHDIHVFNKEATELVVYEKGPKVVQCETKGKLLPNVTNDVQVFAVTNTPTLNVPDLDSYMDAKVLICSPLLANHHELIKKFIPGVRVLTPNFESTSAQRNPDGSIFAREFVEYGETFSKFDQKVDFIAREYLKILLTSVQPDITVKYQDFTHLEVDVQDNMVRITLRIRGGTRRGISIELCVAELNKEKLKEAILEKIDTVLKTIF